MAKKSRPAKKTSRRRDPSKKASKKIAAKSPKTSVPPKKDSASGPQRLQRVLAAAGFGSRRQCEELILEGRVDVDGAVVAKLGTTVDPSMQRIRVDGEPLKAERKVYYAVNKPVGVVTTNSDPQGRPRVVDLVPRTERVFPVGRLDRNSEGLILLTNDGELAQQLAHPKYGVSKIYRVTVAGKVDPETMRSMRKGIYIAEGHVKVEGARILKTRSRATEMEITLREGKNREIRRILARLGHKVLTLRRIAIGTLRLGDVPAGAYRIVSRTEVRKLKTAANEPLDSDRPRRTSNRKGSKGKLGATKSAAQSTRRPTKKRGKRSSERSEFQFTIPGEETVLAGAVIGGDMDESASDKKKIARKPRKKASSGRAKKASGKRSASPKNKPTKRKSKSKSKSTSKKKPVASSRRGAGRAKKRSATSKRSGSKKGRRS